jgi:adenylate kinase/phosphoserine phosphatase
MALNSENESSNMAGSQLNLSPMLKPSSAFKKSKKGVVVGIYGIQGCGKTYLLNQLKQSLGHEDFSFYDGSQIIASFVPGGFSAFQQLSEEKKACWRSLAISRIGQEASSTGRVVIVAGHFMFWTEEQEVGQVVCTEADSNTFTHILYLDVPAEDIAQRRSDDKERARPAMSIDHLRKWQQEEKTQLRRFCYQHGILFSILTNPPHQNLLDKVSILLHDFRHHDEEYNLTLAKSRLDEIILPGQGKVETMLVLDGDKTLAAEDTGALFWKMVQSSDEESPMKALFSSPLGYSYTAFRQAALLHEETTDEQDYEAICEEVALATVIHSELGHWLHQAWQDHLGAIVVNCGLRRVWEKILEKAGLSKTVKVIGGGRIADGFVVTAEVKAAIVHRLQDTHKIFVCAFGDSPLDLPMLMQADQAIVVVIDEQARSRQWKRHYDRLSTTAVFPHDKLCYLALLHHVLIPPNFQSSSLWISIPPLLLPSLVLNNGFILFESTTQQTKMQPCGMHEFPALPYKMLIAESDCISPLNS